MVPSSSFDDSDMNHVPVLVFYSTDEFSILADADPSVSEECKAFIAARVFNHRIFSREWDARYGNPPDPMLRNSLRSNREDETR